MSEPTLPPTPKQIHPHLNEIAKRLFSKHAAVMVGSGFSKNARPIITTAPPFPDWRELGDTLYELLNNETPTPKDRYLSVLSLAHEVEMAIGRPALNQLLKRTIPDDHYDPSTLHVRLLELPWIDVFTTNYDTLLERASHEVTRQQYELIVTQTDLVYSQTPRIIKLHGSFGHKHRIVVTDEDYRQYPIQSPALVNTVRQSLLENTLCLIGFSATDPNFLQWIGWIHDTLGHKNAPLMYMIVSAELTPTQTRMLSDRNIIAVEMSRYHDIKNEDHYGCLNRFIQYMHSQRDQYDGRSWKPSTTTEVDGKEHKIAEKLTRLIELWTTDRRTYPGWVYLPRQRRNTLWDRTERWILHAKESNEVKLDLRLRFIYETLWRMEKCLSRLDDRQIPSIESILDTSLQHQTNTDGRMAETKSTSSVPRDSPDVDHMVHFISIAVMRYFREEGRFDKWEKYNSILSAVLLNLSPENRSRLHYERCLRSLFQLDIQKLRSDLEKWPVDESQPFAEAKRAALQAELGLLSTARTTLETSLSSIRSKSSLRPVTTNYTGVSEESIVMLILHSVQQAEYYRQGKYSELLRVPKEFNERWSVLRDYECDPWDELETFSHSLSRPGIRNFPVRIESTFDIGHRRRKLTLGSDDPSLKQSYRFFRFCEDTGLPFMVPRYRISVDVATKALAAISDFSPYWAIVTLIRTGESKGVESIFGRQALANMSKTDVDQVVMMCLDAIDQVPSQITNDSIINEGLIEGITKVVPEILSRCAVKCSTGLRDKLVGLLRSIYHSSHRRMYEGVDTLVRRLIVAASPEELSKYIPMFLDFPILSWTDRLDERKFPNPMGVVADAKSAQLPVVRISRSSVSKLVSEGRSSMGPRKRWIIASLRTLYACNALTSRQVDLFSVILRNSGAEVVATAEAGVRWHILFSLPYPSELDRRKLFFDHIRHLVVNDKDDDRYIIFPLPIDTFCADIIQCAERVEWTSPEAEFVLTKLVEWWDRFGGTVDLNDESSHYGGMIDQVEWSLSLLIEAFRVVLSVVSLNSLSEQIIESVDRTIGNIRQSRLPCLQLETLRQLGEFGIRNDLAHEIEVSLASFDEDAVHDGLVSALILSQKLDSRMVDEQRASLLRVFVAIVQLIRFRRDFTVSFALNVVRQVVGEHDWILKDPVEDQLLSGLGQIMTDTSGQDTRGHVLRRAAGGTDVDMMMAIRRSAVALASCLYEKYGRTEVDPPEVIMDWKAVSESEEEFSEIRNAWVS